MKARKVISASNLPMRSPLIATLVYWLVLEHFAAPEWVWGVVGTLVIIVWIVWIVDVIMRDSVDLLKND